MKHSGTIVSIAGDGQSFVLAEVGRWQGRDGRTVLTHLTISLTPGTQLSLVSRSAHAASGFPGDFVETPVPRLWLDVGDHVTVDCLHDGSRLVALKIGVMELPALDEGTGLGR